MKKLKIDNNIYLASQEINVNEVVEVQKDVNHIIVIDVSGSMSSDLPEIRKNLKNKISNLVKHENDTISIIWFSGKNDAGILKEGVKVNSLKQLNDLNEAIDKFLKPIGMTAFAKPLELATDIIDRLDKNSVNSLIFMSDGYNNDVPWSSVTAALNKLAPKLSSSCVVEYGNYADSKKLSEMALAFGGSKINCQDFSEYDVVISDSLNKKVLGGKKILVDIKDNLYDYAFSVQNNEILMYNIVDNKVMVNENLSNIYYFTSNSIMGIPFHENEIEDSLYAALYILADRLEYDFAEKLFGVLGDNFYYKELMNAFGKQKLNKFKNDIKACVTDSSLRYPNGKSKIKPVDDNAYCLMNLIDELSKSDLKFYPNHEEFNYNRIGRKKVAVGDKLNENDKAKLAGAKTVAEMVEIAKELEEKKINTEFINTDPNRGYLLNNLVFNEERANLSVRIKIDGTVKLPENRFGVDELSTYKYNSFTFIKDGILNITKLPIDINNNFIETILKPNNVGFEINNNACVIDLSSLPIINRGMAKDISAVDLAKMEFELLKNQASAKVFGDYKKNLFPKTSENFASLLGNECSEWLKTIGVTEFNGYNPPSSLAESTDVYYSVNLITKIKNYSTLPKVADVVAKVIAGSTLKPTEWLMSSAIDEILPRLNDENLEEFIVNRTDEIISQKRAIMQKISEIKFGLILSRGWFKEFKSFDDNKLDLVIDNQPLSFTFDLCEKEVKL